MDQLKEHPQIVELLDTLDKNGLMKEKSEVQSLVSYIGTLDRVLQKCSASFRICAVKSI